ncbi:MAG TPA: hypothetical protein VJW17_14710 [Pyrinomonadaceae bacterium]|nr:hypothetical protein [Pyrinomonadaceae bacterium]
MRDQEMLRMMKAAENQQVGQLAQEIIESENSAQVFEYFADRSTTAILLPLLTEIHAKLRQRDGVHADLKSSQGVFSPWRVATQSLDWETVKPWLIDELLKCIPGYLRLLNSIYYFWLATDKHTHAQREPARAAVLDKCRQELVKGDGSVLCASVDRDFPWVLFHLVFTPDYQMPDPVPYGTSQHWAWLGPIVLNGMKICPAVLMPQLIIIANAWETRAREVIAYRFNDELLNSWFGEQANDVIRIVREFDLATVAQLEPNALGYLKAAKEEAERRLIATQAQPQ